MAAPRRRQREIGHIRDDILEAAARAFGRVGPARATMQDIAREAGYTAASLYTYFRSKEEIFQALLETLTNEYVRTFDDAMPEGLSFQQRFELLLLRQLELAERRRSLFASFALIGGAEDVESAASATCFHANFERRIETLREWFRRNATPEDLGGHDPEVAARFLFGFVFGLIHAWFRSSPTVSLIERAPLIVRLFFHGVSSPSSSSRK